MSSEPSQSAKPERQAKEDVRLMYDALARASSRHIGVPDDEYLYGWTRFGAAERYFYRRKIDTAVRLGDLKTGSRLLEAGSSFGHVTFILANMGFDVTAIDLSPESVAYGNRIRDDRREQRVRFEQADAENLTLFGDGTFDAVVAFSLLRFVPDPGKALREFARVVRPGGRVVVDFPNRWCPWFSVGKRLSGTAVHIHDRLFTPPETRALLAAANLRDIRQETLLFTPKTCPAALFHVFRAAGAALERIPGVNQTGGIIMSSGVR